MGAGDVVVYGPMRPDLLDAALTGNVVVADTLTICSYGKGLIVAVVVKAA